MLRGLLEDTQAQFGGCLLIDCHSMPSAAGATDGRDAADIVLGDCHGAACGDRPRRRGAPLSRRARLFVALNAPYAGGFTTGHYGHPRRGRHALQIEINRALYMDERSYRRKPAFALLAQEMAGLVDRLGGVMRECLAHPI